MDKTPLNHYSSSSGDQGGGANQQPDAWNSILFNNPLLFFFSFFVLFYCVTPPFTYQVKRATKKWQEKKRKKQPCRSASWQTAPVSTENRARQIPIRAPVTKEKQLLFASASYQKKNLRRRMYNQVTSLYRRRHPRSCLVFHTLSSTRNNSRECSRIVCRDWTHHVGKRERKRKRKPGAPPSTWDVRVFSLKFTEQFSFLAVFL